MASKRRLRRIAERKQQNRCTKKIKHASWEAAIIVRKRMRSQGKDTSGLQAYKCPHCGFWHLGGFCA